MNLKADSGTLYRRVGINLRTLRKQSNLTQGDLADLASLSRNSITNIEAGTQRIQLHTMIAICDALGCTVPDLIGSQNKPTIAKRIMQLQNEMESVKYMSGSDTELQSIKLSTLLLILNKTGLTEDDLKSPQREQSVKNSFQNRITQIQNELDVLKRDLLT